MTVPHAHAAVRPLAIGHADDAVRRYCDRRWIAVARSGVSDPSRRSPGRATITCAHHINPARLVLRLVADLTASQRDNPLFWRKDSHRRHDGTVWISQRDDPAAEAEAGTVVGGTGEKNFVGDNFEPVAVRWTRGQQNGAGVRALDYIACPRRPKRTQITRLVLVKGAGRRARGAGRGAHGLAHNSIPASSGWSLRSPKLNGPSHS